MSGYSGATNTTPSYPLANDTQAVSYCFNTKNTYIALVWPRGFDQLDYVINTLNAHASVKYVKKCSLTKNRMFWLYRHLHKMSYNTALKYFKPYITAKVTEPLQVAAIVFQTDEPLEKLLEWKKEMRAYIGQSYYSVHINDHYYPETMQAAYTIFFNLKCIQERHGENSI